MPYAICYTQILKFGCLQNQVCWRFFYTTHLKNTPFSNNRRYVSVPIHDCYAQNCNLSFNDSLALVNLN